MLIIILKAILFDLDGTLLPLNQATFEKTYFKKLSQALSLKGYETNAVLSGVMNGVFKMINNTGETTNDDVFWNSFSSDLGEGIRDEEPYLELFYKTEFQKIKEICGYNKTAVELVESLQEKNIKLVLATQPVLPKIATESRLKWSGLKPEFFSLITTYDNSHYCKPNHKFYYEILKKINILPEECLMVGNDVFDDMAAENIGINVFLLTDNLINKHNVDISKYPKGNFSDLRKYLENENIL